MLRLVLDFDCRGACAKRLANQTGAWHKRFYSYAENFVPGMSCGDKPGPGHERDHQQGPNPGKIRREIVSFMVMAVIYPIKRL